MNDFRITFYYPNIKAFHRYRFAIVTIEFLKAMKFVNFIYAIVAKTKS